MVWSRGVVTCVDWRGHTGRSRGLNGVVTWPGAGAGVLRLLARGTPAAEFIICVEIDFGRTTLFFYVRSKRLRTRKVFFNCFARVNSHANPSTYSVS